MLKNKQVINTILIIVFAFLSGFAIANIVNPQASHIVSVKGIEGGIFAEIKNILNTTHLETELPSEQEFMDGAIKGYVASLDDPYTVYYNAEEWQQLQADNSGEFSGIGVKLSQFQGQIVIDTPLKNSPAESAGINPGDVIIEVEGKATQEMNLAEVAELIRGEAGTSVDLTVLSADTNERAQISVVRQDFDIDSVTFQDKENAGIISISQFTESNLAEFVNQWDTAVQEFLATGKDNLVLDLRNNTGGWVNAAQYVAEEFLTEGTIILREVDRAGNETQLKAQRDGRLKDKNIIILVNKGSASASEIVAGALQDHEQAELLGTSTLGKGVEQSIVELSDGGRLFVVFKKWLTPSGQNLSSSQALQPEIEVDLDTSMREQDEQLQAALEKFN